MTIFPLPDLPGAECLPIDVPKEFINDGKPYNTDKAVGYAIAITDVRESICSNPKCFKLIKL